MRWRDLDDPSVFHAYMETIDARLRDQGVDIPARPILACGLISEECRIKFLMNSDVSDRIHGWFEGRYGDGLKIHMNIGQMLVHIHGDPFRVTYPVIYGTRRVEPLTWIEKVTESLLLSLPADVVEDLARAIIIGFYAFCDIRSGLPASVTADLDAAPAYALQRPAEPGLSKWASQQACEKALSAYVEKRGGNPRERNKGAKGSTHDLHWLAHLAERVGLAPCDPQLIDKVDCSPDIRYPGRVHTPMIEAVLANQAAVAICAHVARHGHWATQ